MFASIHRRHWIAALVGILSVPLFRPTKIAIVTWCFFRATRRITDFLIRQIPLPPLPPVVYAIPGNWGVSSTVYWIASSTDRRHAPGCRYYRRVPGCTGPRIRGKACRLCGS